MGRDHFLSNASEKVAMRSEIHSTLIWSEKTGTFKQSEAQRLKRRGKVG